MTVEQWLACGLMIGGFVWTILRDRRKEQEAARRGFEVVVPGGGGGGGRDGRGADEAKR